MSEVFELTGRAREELEKFLEHKDRLVQFEDNVRAMIARDMAAFRHDRECLGCGHDQHEAGLCLRIPLFTTEKRCGCPFGPETGAAA